MSFGETLRTAREAKGLTTSQLAAATRILVQVIEGLEKENFKRIPAAIYGRGWSGALGRANDAALLKGVDEAGRMVVANAHLALKV